MGTSDQANNQPGSAATTERLDRLMSHPVNKSCADCGAPYPKWGIINIWCVHLY